MERRWNEDDVITTYLGIRVRRAWSARELGGCETELDTFIRTNLGHGSSGSMQTVGSVLRRLSMSVCPSKLEKGVLSKVDESQHRDRELHRVQSRLIRARGMIRFLY
jgi:hypothetical protein